MMKVGFFVGEFPAYSETFIINQVADLLDRGIDVTIYALAHGDASMAQERYATYRMHNRTQIVSMPASRVERVMGLPKLFLRYFAKKNLRAFFRALNVPRFGSYAASLKLAYWASAFLGCDVDLMHCHFGTMGNRFLMIRDVLGMHTPIVTSFYGYDVSQIVKQKGPRYYDRLKKEASAFIVMSNDMKLRVAALGIPEEKIEVLPVSVVVETYPYHERQLKEGEIPNIVTVGRFVEKKGIDDFLRACAELKHMGKQFRATIIGGGELEKGLRALDAELGTSDVVTFTGPLKMERMIEEISRAHLYVQSSKTAVNGDME